MKQAIGGTEDNNMFIIYDYDGNIKNLPEGASYYDVVDLTDEQLEEIKNATSEKINDILFKYF